MILLRAPHHKTGSLTNRTRRDRPGGLLRAPSASFAIVVIAVIALLGRATEAEAQCTPDTIPVVDNGSVRCTGTGLSGVPDSTGYEAPVGVDGLTVIVSTTDSGGTLVGNVIIDESDPGLSAALGVNDNNTITVEGGTQIFVTQDSGFGIRGALDNTITFNGDLGLGSAATGLNNARGISIGDATPMSTNSGVSIGSSSIFVVFGTNNIAVEVGDDQGVNTAGSLSISGSMSHGIVAGDRTDFTLMKSILNSGTINVGTVGGGSTGGIGISAGDGWYPSDTSAGSSVADFSVSILNGLIRNTGTINVHGDNGFGIRAGDDANLTNHHNAYVTNRATINVLGNNAVGISVGGNDFAPVGPTGTQPRSIENGSNGSIVGTGMHGPLAEFRASGSSNNVLVNLGAITAATPMRIAIQGTAGVEKIITSGSITGLVRLGGGEDIFEIVNAASLNGMIDGEGGTSDTVRLLDTTAVRTFDVGQMQNVEFLEIGGAATGPAEWSLTNAGGFSGTTRVLPNGTLVAATPTPLGGNLVIDPAGTLDLTIDPGLTPALTVTGSATLDGTLIVRSPANLSPNTYPLLTAASVTGQFATPPNFTDASALRRYTLVPSTTGLSVRFEILGFTAAAQNANQSKIAQHLAGIETASATAGPEIRTLLTELRNSTGSVSAAFNALSPEAYDAQTAVLIEGGRRIAGLLMERPRECRGDELEPWAGLSAPLPCHARSWAPWVAATGSFRSREDHLGHPRYDAQFGGFVFGVDAHPIDGLDLTLAASAQSGTVDVANAGSSDLTMIDLSGHAAYSYGPLRAQAFASWGGGFHENSRDIRIGAATPINVRGADDHESTRVTVAGELGAEFEVGPIRVEPLVGVDWAWIDQDAFTESGAGPFGLAVSSRDDSMGSISGGLRLSTVVHQTQYLARQLEWMDGVWRPQIDVRYRRAFSGHEREIEARLIGAPSSVPNFKVDAKEDRAGYDIGAGVSFVPTHANRLQFGLRYKAYVASHTLEHNLSFRIALGF